MSFLKRNFLASMSEDFLEGKSILISGGTGSFGKAFIRAVLKRYSPRKLIVYSRDELKQYEMAEEFSGSADILRYFIGDVRDQARLEIAMRNVDYVIHAAALKHVPIAEYNPFECIHTNVIGAENVCRAAFRCGVKRLVALSTDKAVSPINLYGASKLASDKICIAANSMSGDIGTRFSVVRYGNVVGSRGSVVPLFRRLIVSGAATLPITDPRMTRFWITLDQGVDFVISSLGMMQGGEIFIPKIPSMQITSLAKAIAPTTSQRTVGIRPGEKLHEVMITSDDSRNTVELDDRYIIEPQFCTWQYESHAGRSGKIRDETFSYSSDTNTEWLEVEDMKAFLSQ